VSERPHLWAVVSDLHCNSTVGLCPASGVRLDDGGTYMPSNSQVWLWERWLETWARVADLSLELDASLRVVINGDVVDGDHHGTAQIISRNMETQHETAMAVLDPVRSLAPDHVFVVRGTEAHVGKSAQFEEAIARWLGAEEDPATGAASWWHLEAESNGSLLDFLHHGRMGQRPWTKMTGPGTLAAEIVLDRTSDGLQPPDIAVRSHHHRWSDSGDNFRTRVIQIAGWQLSTAFIHRINSAAALPSIGGLIIVTHPDGRIEVEKIKHHVKRRSPWASN